MKLPRFFDIHSHLLPGLDDGAADLAQSLAMARQAVAEGVEMALCTPHQGGRYRATHAAAIREAVKRLRAALAEARIPLEIGVGGDVRIEADLPQRLAAGEIATLNDHGRHVLLELPHEVYWPLDTLAAQLARRGVTGILTHPERNAEIAARPQLLDEVIAAGCLVQITADSLLGRFGPLAERVSRRWLAKGQVHFVAGDAHDTAYRPFRGRQAFARIAEWTDSDTAEALLSRNPKAVIEGREIPPLPSVVTSRKRRWWSLVAQ